MTILWFVIDSTSTSDSCTSFQSLVFLSSALLLVFAIWIKFFVSWFGTIHWSLLLNGVLVFQLNLFTATRSFLFLSRRVSRLVFTNYGQVCSFFVLLHFWGEFEDLEVFWKELVLNAALIWQSFTFEANLFAFGKLFDTRYDQSFLEILEKFVPIYNPKALFLLSSFHRVIFFDFDELVKFAC